MSTFAFTWFAVVVFIKILRLYVPHILILWRLLLMFTLLMTFIVVIFRKGLRFQEILTDDK